MTFIIKSNPVNDFLTLDILFSDANFYTIQFKIFKSIMNECTNRNGHYSFTLLVFGQPITDTANLIAKVSVVITDNCNRFAMWENGRCNPCSVGITMKSIFDKLYRIMARANGIEPR